jgi:hypothetical protein
VVAVGVSGVSGCGGSSKHSSSSVAANPVTTGAQTTVAATTTTAGTATTAPATTTQPAASSSTTSSATQPSATQPSTTPTGASNGSGGAGVNTSSNPNGGSTNARVPATFIVNASGRLVPPVISAPAFLAVQASFISHDGTALTVLIKAPKPRTLKVPAGGKASVLIPGLRAGRYPILLDGKRAGALSIGGEPGP